MNEAEAKALVLDVLSAIAPEADLAALPGNAILRDELDRNFDGFSELHCRVA